MKPHIEIHTDKPKKISASKQRQLDAIAKLREWLRPGDTVFTILRNVSRSGMSREIGIVIFKNGSDLHPNYLVSEALGYKIGKHDGLKVSGCGMDMGFSVVYNLGRVLFPDGFDLPPGKIGRNGDTSGHDNDGGYALNQRWL